MVWCHVAETSKGPHSKCNQDEEHPRSGLKCVHQKGRKDLDASQSIETNEDLLFGIPSRKQPLNPNPSAQMNSATTKFILFFKMFSFAPLVLFWSKFSK